MLKWWSWPIIWLLFIVAAYGLGIFVIFKVVGG